MFIRRNYALLIIKINGDTHITKSNKLCTAIVYLYCPTIGTSSTSLLQKSDKIEELLFCYFSSFYLKTYKFGARSQREVSR